MMDPSLLEESVEHRVPIHDGCGAVCVSVVACVVIGLIVEPTE